jgi:hypothetical protein
MVVNCELVFLVCVPPPHPNTQVSSHKLMVYLTSPLLCSDAL